MALKKDSKFVVFLKKLAIFLFSWLCENGKQGMGGLELKGGSLALA